MNSSNEAFSRILVDKALEYSDWNLLDGKQVEFEYHNGVGRADYLLKDSLGRVLCVLEAKREDHDPYDAKEQARGYAENLKAPFVILSNGREHWFWNLERANERDAYRIERLPSREDLERVQLKNLQPAKPLQTQLVRPDFLQALNPDVVLGAYQSSPCHRLLHAQRSNANQPEIQRIGTFYVEATVATTTTAKGVHPAIDPNPRSGSRASHQPPATG